MQHSEKNRDFWRTQLTAPPAQVALFPFNCCIHTLGISKLSLIISGKVLKEDNMD